MPTSQRAVLGDPLGLLGLHAGVLFGSQGKTQSMGIRALYYNGLYVLQYPPSQWEL